MFININEALESTWAAIILSSGGTNENEAHVACDSYLQNSIKESERTHTHTSVIPVNLKSF